MHHPARTGYRALLASADTSFVVLAAAARLPTAMLPLGILLYVADRTGSYGAGGLAVAALSIGGGIGGPLVGVAADRAGQRVVALGATSVQVTGLATLLLVGDSAGLAVVLAAAAVVGVANPQAGAMARSRWSAIGRSQAQPDSFTATAMAWEGAVDETSFVVGPVLVGTLAGVVSPTAALALALVLAATTQSAFGAHRSALPGHRPTHRLQDAVRAPLPLGRLACLLLAMGAVGVVFGVTQTGVAARMAQDGTAGLTGPVYAALGVGSAVAGLLTTRLPSAVSLPARIATGGLLLVLAGLLTAPAEHAAALAGGCLLLGVALGPVLVSCYALAQQLAPQEWATTAMTALATANVVGVAAGAAVAGVLVDQVSPGAALLVNGVAGALVLVAGVLTGVLRERAPARG
jgi:MFS family permease